LSKNTPKIPFFAILAHLLIKYFISENIRNYFTVKKIDTVRINAIMNVVLVGESPVQLRLA
jgi:hypothetical protein